MELRRKKWRTNVEGRDKSNKNGKSKGRRKREANWDTEKI